MIRRLNEIPGISIEDDRHDKRPGILLSTLANDEARAKFLAVYDDYLAELRTAAGPAGA